MSSPARRLRVAQRDPGTPLRCVIYCRVSSERQAAEGLTSLDEQEAACRRFAESKGWRVVEVYREEGGTGTVDLDPKRPEWVRVDRAAREGQFEVVLFHKWNRVARKTMVGLKMIEAIEEALGIVFAVAEMDIDVTTPAGRYMRTQMLAFAEMQHADLLGTMAGGAHGKFRDGRWPSSDRAAPFGYCVHREGATPAELRRSARLVPSDREKLTVETAETMLVFEGRGVPETALALNAQGLLPRPLLRKVDGQVEVVPLEWSAHRLRLALSRPTLMGRIHWGAGRFATGKYGPPVEMQVEPILPPDRFEALQRMLVVHGPRQEPERAYAWSQRVESACSRLYVGTHRVASGSRKMKCQGKRTRTGEPACGCPWITDADEFEARLWRAVCDKLGDPDQMVALAREHLAIAEGRAAGAEEERAELLAQARRRREAMTANAQAMMRSGVEPSTVATVMKAEQDECEALERRAADIARFIADGKVRTDALDAVAGLAVHMADRLPGLDTEGQRLVVATLDLRARFEDPADPDSPVHIVGMRGTGDLAEIGLTGDSDPWSSGIRETLPSLSLVVTA